MVVLVIGSALRQVCDDQAALGLRFIEEVNTAPRYRLIAVDDQFAALVEDENAGVSVAGELVQVDDSRWEEIIAAEPEGITFEQVELSDGRSAIAAVGDPNRVLESGTDISEFGSYAAYLAAGRVP